MQCSFPVPMRTIPVDCSFEGANALRTFARILVHPAGHSLGNSRVGSLHVPSGSFASCKAGVPMPWVRHREKILVHALECHSDVLDYRTYPHCLEAVLNGVRIQYIPDAAYERADGSVHVVAFIEPTKGRFELISAIYAKLGWVFRILDRSEYEIRSPKAQFLARLLTYKNAEFSAADSFLAKGLLSASGGRVQFEKLVALLGGYPRGFAKLCAMHLAQQLAIDFDDMNSSPLWVSAPNCSSERKALTFKLWLQNHD